MIIEILSTLLNIAVLIYAGSSMLSVGIGHTLRQIVGPLRNTRAVIRALVGNFVLVPLLALVVMQIFQLDRSLAVGLFLVASGAGAPFLIKLAQAAETNVALSATLLVVLLPATILYLPIINPSMRRITMTRNIPRDVLPIPDRPYVGPAPYEAKEPDARFEPMSPLRPPQGAPNILLVLIDDAGFGSNSAFDQGWDRVREETSARQKELGVIPPDCELRSRPDGIPFRVIKADLISDEDVKWHSQNGVNCY